MRNRVKYIPVQGDVQMSTPFEQAANLLDVAAQAAVKSGDVEGMALVASQWTALGATIQGVVQLQTEGEIDLDTDTQRVVGFVAPEKEAL